MGLCSVNAAGCVGKPVLERRKDCLAVPVLSFKAQDRRASGIVAR